jgi:hypothetical protein
MRIEERNKTAGTLGAHCKANNEITTEEATVHGHPGNLSHPSHSHRYASDPIKRAKVDAARDADKKKPINPRSDQGTTVTAMTTRNLTY